MSLTAPFCDSFDPEAIRDLHMAFQRAWGFIQTGGFVSPLDEDIAQARVARHVIAIACSGEKNVTRLANLTIGRFRQDQKQFNHELLVSKSAEASCVLHDNGSDCPSIVPA